MEIEEERDRVPIEEEAGLSQQKFSLFMKFACRRALVFLCSSCSSYSKRLRLLMTLLGYQFSEIYENKLRPYSIEEGSIMHDMLGFYQFLKEVPRCPTQQKMQHSYIFLNEHIHNLDSLSCSQSFSNIRIKLYTWASRLFFSKTQSVTEEKHLGRAEEVRCLRVRSILLEHWQHCVHIVQQFR